MGSRKEGRCLPVGDDDLLQVRAGVAQRVEHAFAAGQPAAAGNIKDLKVE